MEETRYGMRVELPIGYEEAVERTTAALKTEGFGVLTTIDVKQTIKQKLDKDFRKYVILGACNPPIAYQALSTEIELGLLLPCNVIVYEGDDGKAVVVAIDPMQTIAASSPRLASIATEVRERLTRVLEKLG